MLVPIPISDLVELRERAKLSQADAARLCGLTGRQSRKTFANWEQGVAPPRKSRRKKVIGYLWDYLRLREMPEEFERIWGILADRWNWDAISNEEWQTFTTTKRPICQEELGVSEKLNQLLARLPATAPLRSPVPLQKPLRVPYFTGREREIDSLLSELQPGKIHTLCGPGGVGKSALAAEAVWRLAPSDEPPPNFPDGVLFHSFYHQPKVNLAMEAIARAFNVEPRPSARDAARMALAGRKALIILDGTEVADDLPSLLALASTCGVLITTQRRGDALVSLQDVKPLPQRESLNLLRSWAGALVNDDETANTVVQLLDGMPLALQLVGRYMVQRQQGVKEYASWLTEQRLAALHFAERSSMSIPLLLGRSLAMVSGMAQAAFGIIGILAMAPFNAMVVATGLETSIWATHHALGELVDYGLLLRRDDRYQVMHALAYRYARDRMAPDAATVSRLALSYSYLTDEATRGGAVGYAFLDRERQHIVAVVETALNAEQWYAVQDLSWSVWNYLDMQGYTTDCETVLQAGLSAARSTNERQHEMALLNALGNTYASRGNFSQAHTLYQELLTIALECGGDIEKAAALGSMALTYRALGESHTAIQLFDEVLLIYRKCGDRAGEARTLGNLGVSYFQLGKPRRAIALHKQALRIWVELGERREEATTRGNLGSCHTALGNPDLALDLHETQLKIMEDLGDRRGQSIALGNKGNAFALLGKHETAIELYERQLAIARTIGDREGEVYAIGNLGSAFADLGDHPGATELVMQHLSLATEIGNKHEQRRALTNLGVSYAATGEIQRAAQLLLDAIEIARQIGDLLGEAHSCWNLGLLLSIRGDLKSAVDLMQVCVTYEQMIGHPDAEIKGRHLDELRRLLASQSD